MKSLKPQELREMNDQQLRDALAERVHKLFDLRFRSAIERLESPMQLRYLRKDIARIKTIQRERELAAASA